MKMRMWFLGATLLGAGLVAAAWMGSKSEAKPAASTARVAPVLTVSVTKPERKALVDSIQVVGATRSREDVMVITELTGLRVQRVEADVGDYVKAGQTLAVLDGQSLDIERNELRSEFERTRGEYERMRPLLSSQLVSLEFSKQKQAAYEVARSRYENAQLKVQRTRVVAPAAGFIFRRTATIGGLTDGSVPLFVIAKDGEVEMEASVPEALVGRLKQGMSASVEVVGRADAISGEIRLITPDVDNLSRAAKVRIRLRAEGSLPVGAFSQARIEVAKVEGWTIPPSALQQDTEGAYIWNVDTDGMVKRLPVTPTMRTTESVVVSEALGDQRIVAKAGPFLRENDRVVIAESAK